MFKSSLEIAVLFLYNQDRQLGTSRDAAGRTANYVNFLWTVVMRLGLKAPAEWWLEKEMIRCFWKCCKLNRIMFHCS